MADTTRAEPSPNVRLQNLRDFTVQIRSPLNDSIAGTGLALNRDGQVVTCAHVVQAVLGMHPRDACKRSDAEVGVYFPQARGGEQKDRRATISGCFPGHDDDVVLLQLAGDPPPLGPEQMPALGRAEDSAYHGFRSYGYRRLEAYRAGHAHGTILGPVEDPEGRTLLVEPVQLESQQIDKGMSGAAVLDIERNLVVGLVAEIWRPHRGSSRDRDAGWAVDARVLSLEPLNLALHDRPLEKRAAPPIRLEHTEVAQARASVGPALGVEWNNAPPTLEEWTGRDELLAALDRDWADPGRRVTGLVGFGGEGKSSLARQWVESLLARPAATEEEETAPPDGVFWWGFYEKPSVDEFFEAALAWLGGETMIQRVRGASVRAQVLSAMLGAGRYLFVLDGLEVMQHQDGDRYGLLRSADLRAFLELLAAPAHGSFCLLTSRAPVLDLMAYTTYNHRDVARLAPAEGRALLRKLGVHGPDEALDRAVAHWDGHALTLSLLGGYLADRFGGDAAHFGDVPPPSADEPRYERVHRVLRRYDEHLGEPERAFLTLFSAFRTPVHQDAFAKVFRAPVEAQEEPGFIDRLLARRGAVSPPLRAPLAVMDDEAFATTVERLVTYRLLRHDPAEKTYTAHPLVCEHYLALLTAGAWAAQEDAHTRIKDYYLEVAGDTPEFPSLDDLAPLIEVVHHACRAGTFDQAWQVVWERIYQQHRYVIAHILGAYDIALSVLLEFFPADRPSQAPAVSDPQIQGWILNSIGHHLMSLGRLSEAVPFYEKAVAMYADLEDWGNSSQGYINLAELQIHLGALSASAEAAGEALALAHGAGDNWCKMDSLAWQAWATHQSGDLTAAGEAFAEAEVLQGHTLSSLRGIFHADHLHRAGQADRARRVTETNLKICESNHWAKSISHCHRVLGDLDAGAGDPSRAHSAAARAHYDQALKIARGITVRDVLIEALLARGRWAARHEPQDLTGSEDLSGLAFADLEEALAYALEGGYRIYETDARVGLAWAHLAAGDPARARAEAQRARQLSASMGYHWGQVDADEVLAAL